MDKALAYGARDPGFKSRYGLLFFFFVEGFFLFFEDRKKSPRRDSNPQPPDPKSDALSIAPLGRITLSSVAVKTL